MKKYFALFFALFFTAITNAQQKKLLFDHEKIFTPTERIRLDGMLQEYRKSTGRIVLINTDTSDVSNGAYADNLVNQFVTDSISKPFIFMLLLSRKNQLILASVNDQVKPFIKGLGNVE